MGGLVGAAGHRGDDDRGIEALAEQLDAAVDRVGVHLGQRVVDQLHLLEEAGLLAEVDAVAGAEGEVVLLALRDVEAVRHAGEHSRSMRRRRVM